MNPVTNKIYVAHYATGGKTVIIRARGPSLAAIVSGVANGAMGLVEVYRVP